MASLPSVPYWQPALGQLGQVVTGLDDISQCLLVLFQTPKGAVTHVPDFGCDAWRWLDKPMPVALPRIVEALSEAATRWEPRAKLGSISCSLLELGHARLLIPWAPVGSEDWQTLEVSL